MDKFILKLPKGAPNKRKIGELNNKSSPRRSCTVSGTTNNSTKIDANFKSSAGSNVNSNTKSTQMFLDLGQKSFAKSAQCAKCKMVYLQSDASDVKCHELYCSKSCTGPVLNNFQGYKVCFQKDDDAVLEVLMLTDKSKSRVLSSVWEIVERELGCTSEFAREGKATVYLYVIKTIIVGCLVVEDVAVSNTVQLSSGEEERVRPIFVVKAISSLGAAPKTVPIAVSHQDPKLDLDTTTDDSAVHSSSSSSSSSFSCSSSLSSSTTSPSATTASSTKKTLQQTAASASSSSSSSAAASSSSSSSSASSSASSSSSSSGTHLLLMGVRIIWVHDKHRRKGIAQRLVNTARQYHMFGTSIDKSNIAFSQPTEDGFKFASSYTKSPTGTVIAY